MFNPPGQKQNWLIRNNRKLQLYPEVICDKDEKYNLSLLPVHVFFGSFSS